jgi:hypothetical protein
MQGYVLITDSIDWLTKKQVVSPSPKTNQGGTRASPTIWLSIGSKLANVERRDLSKQFSTLRSERGISWNMWDYPWLHASLLLFALSSLQKIYPASSKSDHWRCPNFTRTKHTCDTIGLKQSTNMSSITFFPPPGLLIACYRFHSIWIPKTPLSVFGDRQHVMGLPEMMIEGLWRMQNLMVNAKTSIYTSSCHYGSVIPYI